MMSFHWSSILISAGCILLIVIELAGLLVLVALYLKLDRWHQIVKNGHQHWLVLTDQQASKMTKLNQLLLVAVDAFGGWQSQLALRTLTGSLKWIRKLVPFLP
jgi:hypothetical protein